MFASWEQLTLDSWICHGCPKKCFIDNIEQPPIGCQNKDCKPETNEGKKDKKDKNKRWKHEKEEYSNN